MKKKAVTTKKTSKSHRLRRILLGAIIIISLLAFCIYNALQSGKILDKESKAYVDTAIPAMTKNWNENELEKREDQDFRKAVTKEQTKKLVTFFSTKLGH